MATQSTSIINGITVDTQTGAFAGEFVTSYKVKVIASYGLNRDDDAKFEEVEIEINSSNYRYYENIIQNKVLELNQKMITDVFDATEGSVSGIPETMTEDIQVSTTYSSTSYRITEAYELLTEWGLNSVEYNQFELETFNVTAENFRTIVETVSRNGEAQRTRLDNIMNNSNLENLPTEEVVWAASSGNIYIKTTFYLAHQDASHAIIEYNTVYGFTKDYGYPLETMTGLTDKKDNVSINAEDFNNLPVKLHETAAFEQNRVRTLLDFMNITIPANIDGEAHHATNGLTYYFTFKFNVNSRRKDLLTIGYDIYYGLDTKSMTTYYGSDTFNVTKNNKSNASESLSTIRSTQIGNLKIYLNGLIGLFSFSDPKVIQYTAANGENYYYKTDMFVSSRTDNEAIIIINTKYGYSKNSCTIDFDGNYDEIRITPDNYSEYNKLVLDKQGEQEKFVQALLNTFIGTVYIPTAYEYPAITTKSFKRFFARTVFSKESISATKFIMKYTTEWGPSREYYIPNEQGGIISEKSYEITIKNFDNYEAVLTELAKEECAKIHNELALWNVVVPDDIADAWKNPCELFFYYKIDYEQGDTTNNTNSIRYTVSYGESAERNDAIKYKSDVYTFTKLNYETVYGDLQRRVENVVTQMQDELNLRIGVLEFTQRVNTMSAANRLIYWYRTSFEVLSRTVNEARVFVKTDWGQAGQFTNSFRERTVVINKDNYNGYKSVVNTVANAFEGELRDYLNQLIGPITVPKTYDYTYKSKSGKEFYFRVEFEKISETENSAAINYKIFTATSKDNYTQYSSSNFMINIQNYLNFESEMMIEVEKKIKNIYETYKLFEVALPVDTSEHWKNNCNQYYYLKTKFYQGSTTDTENEFFYTISYGKTPTEDELNPDSVYISNKFTFNEETYRRVSENIATVVNKDIADLKEYLSNFIGPVETSVKEEEYIAENGLRYFYQIRTFDINNENESCDIRCQAVYGTSPDYGISFKTLDVHVDASNYLFYKLNVQAAVEQLERDLQAYANTLLNTINIPEDKIIAYETASGKMFYIKVTYLRQTSSPTEFIIDYTTEYGDTTEYGTFYSTKTYSITSSKYNTYVSELTQLANVEINGVKRNFGLWEIQVPSPIMKTFNSKGNITYNLQVTFEQGAVSNTTNTIAYITSFGNAEDEATRFEFSRKNRVFQLTDFSEAYSVLDELATTEIEAVQTYLDTPDIPLPPNYTEIIEKNNFKYQLNINYSKGDQSTVITTTYLDGLIYGAPISISFYSPADAFDTLDVQQKDIIATIKGFIDNSPADTYEDYTVDGMSFRLETKYTKSTNANKAYVRTYLDGVLYRDRDHEVKIGTILTDLADVSELGFTDNSELRGIITTYSPLDKINEYAVGDLRFNVGNRFSKMPGSVTAYFYTVCDEVKFYTGSQIVNGSTLQTNLESLTIASNNKLSDMQEKINQCPTNDSEVFTVNGFKYDLGVQYSKSAGSKQATVKAVLDGVDYGTTLFNLTIDSIESDIATMVKSVEGSRNMLFNITKNSPSNVDRAYTVNGFKYNIGTTYVKNANDTNVIINTFLDDSLYKVSQKSVSATEFTNDLNECINEAERVSYELKQILNASPRDDYETPYMIDGFNYTIGAKFEKILHEDEDGTRISSQNVLVNIMLDGSVHSSYYDKISAQSVAIDIENVRITAQNAVAELKATLRGIPSQVITYSIKGFNFDLSVLYKKNEDYTVSIIPYIDIIQYRDAEVLEFDADNIEKYTDKGKDLIASMKNLINDLTPDNIVETYGVHGFKFNLGVEFEKASGTLDTMLYTTLDGDRIGNPESVEFDITSIGKVSTKANQVLTSLKNRLNLTPADYSKIYTVSGFNFGVGSKFSKFAGSHDVRIITTLDGQDYGASSIKTFQIDNLNALLIEAETKESALKARLDTVPRDTTEKYTIKRFNFNIGSAFNKEANSDIITTMVKLDGTQYSQYHQITFDIDNISSFSLYNDRVITELKARLFTAVPEDIHTTYSRNKFNFTIDAYFSKQENSDVIDIECTIDSADLNNTISTLSYTPEIKAGIADALKSKIDMKTIQQKLKNVRQ